MILNIASGIVALAKAIPAFERMLTQVIDLFTDYKLEKIEEVMATSQEKRNTLINSIARADSNEERRVLSIMLAELNAAPK